MLEIEQPKAVFALEDRADGQVPSIKIQSIRVYGSFLRGSVDNRDSGCHWGLCEDHVILSRPIGGSWIGGCRWIGGVGRATLGTRKSAFVKAGDGRRRKVEGGPIITTTPVEGLRGKYI